MASNIFYISRINNHKTAKTITVMLITRKCVIMLSVTTYKHTFSHLCAL